MWKPGCGRVSFFLNQPPISFIFNMMVSPVTIFWLLMKEPGNAFAFYFHILQNFKLKKFSFFLCLLFIERETSF